MSKSPFRIDIPRALRAARALFANPEDLPQVFTMIEALSGNTIERIERRFARGIAGRRLLLTRPDIVSLLEDREALRRLPEGSLGRTYLAFLESEGISAKGIRDADAMGKSGQRELSPTQIFVSDRMRDTHDLWHAVTGYRGDVLGEVALLAFILAQTWNFGIATVLAVGLLKTLNAPETRKLVIDGFRRGQRAAWLPAAEWEELLAQPIGEVRAWLNIGVPPVYTPMRVIQAKDPQTAKADKSFVVASAA